MADLASKFGSSEDINELLGLLQKEMQKTAYPQDTTTTADIIEIDYDTVIQNREIAEAPFLSFLANKGRVQSSTSAIIGWREKGNGNSSKFTDERGLISGSLPEYGGKTWEKKFANMKVITYPIEVSLLAQMGNSNVDLVDDDRQDGYLDISARRDKAFLLGDHTVDANSYDGINKLAENKEDIDGEPISTDYVDDMLDRVIAKGGTPDCIVTTARVARQLTREQQLNDITVGNLEFVPGGWMESYKAPTGLIPVITNKNLVTLDEDGEVDATSEDILAVVDSSAVINKNLLPVSEFQLGMTKLSNDSLLATFTAFGIPAPWKLGVVQGIGKGS
ncbi:MULTISPECIES: SU10 major capsid protein [Methanobacterium]|uniref:Phage capsid protein n=1 Tax=Methanobacterium bryantii TaxID=2161 RepID=A0A2A2H8L2_METBR|nr:MULTISPECIES: hypothetical protein [Methanobacterium]OEC87885.1 hypothetical protein A9507_06835 [Methanobacterium sp. A39]PAV05752.1 hypothetical protein ASJ80_08445 [Methanobacterium bryantii]